MYCVSPLLLCCCVVEDERKKLEPFHDLSGHLIYCCFDGGVAAKSSENRHLLMTAAVGGLKDQMLEQHLRRGED